MEAEADFRIHVVIVSHDPGLWFDETLESISAQDLPLVDVTVVDAGSESDSTARVQRYLPQAVVHRLDSNPGFGPAANQVLADTDPAPDFFVFCHDDVALAPNALRLLAHEAVRSNAGIVGPKYVDWDDPSRILQVGLIVDKTGVSNPSVEVGELDQEQHDVVQEMFAVPGGCVLVRGDLFRAVGGFDPEMSFCYEHVDLCWRARTVGARVMVAPTAVVRHRQRLADRISRTQTERLVRRHRIRALLSVYGVWHSVRVIPQAMALSAVELLVSLVTGHLRQARQIGASWGIQPGPTGVDTATTAGRRAIPPRRGLPHPPLAVPGPCPSDHSIDELEEQCGRRGLDQEHPGGPVEPVPSLGACGHRHSDLGFARGSGFGRREHSRGWRYGPAGVEF